ncbi:MAG TPA: beta-1,6-N-acetylglucosaminyltransferase [Acetobacteraceae bacterium]|nr:beta-1,6-N-acetylglucosaminyltransferase [Acetobacteraceae bacterium]
MSHSAQPRLGFVILCHDNPLQLVRLVDALLGQGTPIVIHVDGKAPRAVHDAALGLAAIRPEIRYLSRYVCSWGGWSLVQASLDGMELAQRLDPALTHIALLSGTHMPTKKLPDLLADLPADRTLLDYHPRPATGAGGAQNWWTRELLPRLHFLYEEVPGVGPVRISAAETPAELLATGSQWLVVATRHLRALDPALLASAIGTFRASLIPDEMFFQTLFLSGLDRNEIVRKKTTAVEFEADGRPKPMDEPGLSEAAARGYLFGRKVADSTPLGDAFRARLRAREDRPLEQTLFDLTGIALGGAGGVVSGPVLTRGQRPDSHFARTGHVGLRVMQGQFYRRIEALVQGFAKAGNRDIVLRIWRESAPYTAVIIDRALGVSGICLVFRSFDFLNFDAVLCIKEERQADILARLDTPETRRRLAPLMPDYALARETSPIVAFWPWLDLFRDEIRRQGIVTLPEAGWSDALDAFATRWLNRYIQICQLLTEDAAAAAP